MASISLSKGLRAEYERLFSECVINPANVELVRKLCKMLMTHKCRYCDAGRPIGAPWFFVGTIHMLESGASFATHLHNGDPLTDRTVHVPSGRPRNGTPPFMWEESATDALRLQRIDKWCDWTKAGTLYKLEAWNGFGYRVYHSHVLSPYLWSLSNHYSSGKYRADGVWDDHLVSKQCGAAVMLKYMVDIGEIEFAKEVRT